MTLICRNLIATAFVVMSCACVATLHSADGVAMRITSAEFRAYAEDVFRLQNEVISAITFAVEDGQGLEANHLAVIEAAEDAVLEECAEINRIAIRRRDGGGLRPFRDAKAARAVPNCEAAALRGRAALADVASASGQ